MSLEYTDILNAVQEKGNMGGIGQNVFFAPYDDFQQLADKPDENGVRTFGGMNKLSNGQDVLKPGKKLYRIYTTLEKGGLQGARQGEYDGTSHKISLTMFTPGLEAESLDLLMIPNQNWIFYVKTGEKMFRLGNKLYPAKLEAEGEVGTGATTADAKGNTLTFASYEVGFAGEVVDIAAIEAMAIAEDAALTATFTPAHAATGVLVDTDPTVEFAKAIVNADTGIAFTAQQLESVFTITKVDVNGNDVADVAFTASLLTNTVTLAPLAAFDAASIYEVRFDATKILAADTLNRVTGDNYVRFITA